MNIPEEKFERVKKEAEIYYKAIGKIHCPYLGEEVGFNTKGLEHLKFKRKNTPRTTDQQYIDFDYLNWRPIF